MPTIIPTGPDPNYYRDQADRLARSMAIFVADRRRRKEEELAKRQQRVKQIYEAVASGAIPADSAAFEGAVSSLEEYDPETAKHLRFMAKGFTDQQGLLSDVEQDLLEAKDGEQLALIRPALLRLPPHLRARAMKDLGITAEVLWPKKKEVAYPKNAAEAQAMFLRGEITETEKKIYEDAELAEQKRARRKEARGVRQQRRGARMATDYNTAVQVEAHEKKRKIDVANPLPSRASADEDDGDPRPTMDELNKQYNAIFDNLKGSQPTGRDAKNGMSREEMEARSEVRAMLAVELDPAARAFLEEAERRMIANKAWDKAAEIKNEWLGRDRVKGK